MEDANLPKGLTVIYNECYNKYFDVFKDNWKDIALAAMKITHNQAIDLCNQALKENKFDELKVWALEINDDPPF